MNECTGKVAIVTGASRGIGLAIAQRLAAEGAAVLVTARTLRAGTGEAAGSLEEAVAGITAAGGRAAPFVIDLGDPAADRGSVIAAAEAEFGRGVDILVNNVVGPAHFDLGFEGMTREAFLEHIEPSLWAGWDLAIHAVPAMRANGAGWILNIGSATAEPRVGPPYRATTIGGSTLYGGTKAMLDRVTTGAAMDLYDDNIAVNSMGPNSSVMTFGANRYLPLPPQACEPVEVMAEAALALCTGDPKVLTGRVIPSQALLAELGRPVRTLDGRELVEGWQPGDVTGFKPGYVETFRRSLV